MSALLPAFIKTLRHEAGDVISVELRPAPGTVFPNFDAGSHIDLHLPNGLVRHYSLLDPADAPSCYRIGVLLDRKSRGGSKYLHEQMRVGAPLSISAPRNNFPLHEDAARSVLVAGGIGITPLLAMARRLQRLGRPATLWYFSRSRAQAAFVEEIEDLGLPVHWHFDDERGGPADLRSLLAAEPTGAGTHFYACGPAPLLDAFERFCAELGHADAHVERFAPVESAPAVDARTDYVCELARSGRTLRITPEKSLLDQLLDAGVGVQYSCMEGICGTCETAVFAGVPDHRDSILSPAERAAGNVMMVCVSGCRSERLVLDL